MMGEEVIHSAKADVWLHLNQILTKKVKDAMLQIFLELFVIHTGSEVVVA